jgi:hypothetical protein
VVDSAKHTLQSAEGRQLDIHDVDEAYVVINSSTAIDHSNSQIQIESQYVDERSMGR